ncbi:hypothetical protein [Hyphobacterium sp.]|jgi:hypothetical protein|uniref:hypothetical protein n=1 Tax=Hyphobacterium sp. TaxID=2004662 RepID=UPI003BACBE8B
MANPTSAFFQSLGFSGKDVKQIAVNVFPYMFEQGGQLVAGWKAYAGTHCGDIRSSLATDYIFAVTDPDWEFAEFELGGKTWPGLSIYPDDGCATVAFGDENRRSVILQNTCDKLYTHRYQLVLKHRQTGEIAICDPGSGNENGKGGD